MNTGADHSADYKALSILTKGLIGGILLFSILSIVLHYLRAVSDMLQDDASVFFSAVLIVTAIIILITRAIYSKRVNILKETNQTSKEKLDIFRSITITHMALCEVPALLSIVCFILFGNFLFFIAVLMALAEMLMKFPTRGRIESVINSGTF